MMLPRRIEPVSMKSRRKAISQLMMVKVEEDRADTRIVFQAVNRFPNKFKRNNGRANRGKARDWWKTERLQVVSEVHTPKS